MPSASDGPSSPGRGRVQAEPTGSGQTPPSRFAKNPHAPGVCEGTSRPQHHHRKAAVAKEGREDHPSPPVCPGRWVVRSPPSPRHGASLEFSCWLAPSPGPRSDEQRISYLVDPASSHMLVSKIKPCKSKYELSYSETANGSLNQLWFI